MNVWSVSVSRLLHFRSEGEGEAAKIIGKRVGSPRNRVRGIQDCSGNIREADAKASAIYAEAYDQGPETSEFMAF